MCLSVPSNQREPLERRFFVEWTSGSIAQFEDVRPNPQWRYYRDWRDRFVVPQTVQIVPSHRCMHSLFWCCDHELRNTHSKNQCMLVSIASVQDWLLIQTSGQLAR